MKKSHLHIGLTGVALCAAAVVGNPSMAFASPLLPSAHVQTSASVPTPGASGWEVSPESARVSLKGLTDGANVDWSVNGKPTGSSTAHSTTLLPSVPLTAGVVNLITFTQTVEGETSDELSITIDLAATSVEAPQFTRLIGDIAGETFLADISGRPGARVDVVNSRGENVGSGWIQARGGAFTKLDLTGIVDGRITPEFTVTQTYGAVTSSSGSFNFDDEIHRNSADIEAPRVLSQTEKDGVATLTVTAPKGSLVRAQRADGRIVASSGPGEDGKATIRIPYGTYSNDYDLFAALNPRDPQKPFLYSSYVPVTVNETAGPAFAAPPTVKGVTVAGGRAVVSLDGAPGAILRVRDDAGTVVAIKKFGSSSTTQAVIPLPAGTDGDFVADQETSGSMGASSPTAITDLGKR